MTHLTLANAIRSEDDATVIATLLRKGWQALPPQPQPDAAWDGSAWVLPPPAPPPASVTARQIRLWLVGHGVSLDAVAAAIQAIPDAATRATVAVEWEYAPYIERGHPMLLPLAAALGMTSEQVDAAFREAATL